MDYRDLMGRVIECAHSGGELLAAEWSRPGGPRGAGDKADIDIIIESQLREALLGVMNCDFWGEETGSQLQGKENCWVVDPNDGTSDFLRGRKGSAVSIGLLRNKVPVLGVVYAPITPDRGADCISWALGLDGVLRNNQIVPRRLEQLELVPGSLVMMSTAAEGQPKVNSELCSPADFSPMPSIAYRLARVAAGDAVAGASLVPVSAHDVAAGHALLIGAGGVLLDQDGELIRYGTPDLMSRVSQRCFGGAPKACQELARRDWGRLFISS